MSQIKSLECRNFLNKDDSNFKKLIEVFQGVLKTEKALSDAIVKLERQLILSSENEMNGIISKLFEEVGLHTKIINESRKKYIELLEFKLIPSINSQLNEVKEKRTILADYEKKKEMEIKKDLAYRMNNEAAKQNKMQQELEVAKKDSDFAASNLIIRMTHYVDEKNTELKAMFYHLINCQLIYHCMGLEKLSELNQKINAFDHKNETKKMIESWFGQQSARVIEQKQ